jgi:hypothetical protein
MSELPTPLVPVGVDLQNFGFMPLDLHRLRRSKTWRRCRRNPEIGFYCLNLWAASWHELPAGSLEDGPAWRPMVSTSALEGRMVRS